MDQKAAVYVCATVSVAHMKFVKKQLCTVYACTTNGVHMDEVVKSCQLVTSLSLSVLCHKYAAVYECAAVND